jgi:predicted nucleic acid-binding protein
LTTSALSAFVQVWAQQEHRLEGASQPMHVEDGTIAATASRYGLTIVTGSDKAIRRAGVKVFNPFKNTERAK